MSVAFDVLLCHSQAMTNHFEKYLREKAAQSWGKDEEYFVGRYDCFLANSAKMMIADGVDPSELMSLFISHAHEVLGNRPGRRKTPQNMKEDAERVLQAAMRLHHRICDDPAKAA
jgi:hypothetical protein